MRLSIWEARNNIDFRFQIKYSDKNTILNCINEIAKQIDNYRDKEIKNVTNLLEFELRVFNEGVKNLLGKSDDNFEKLTIDNIYDMKLNDIKDTELILIKILNQNNILVAETLMRNRDFF